MPKYRKRILKFEEKIEMPKYRQKSVVVEAIQFEDTAECLERLSKFVGDDIVINYKAVPPVVNIHTREGTMTANVGDYIVKGINDEFYPVKSNFFEKIYEKVD